LYDEEQNYTWIGIFAWSFPAGDIASLHTALSSNTAVKSALAKAKVDINAVVAVNVSNNGELTVYVR
jgi:hypothetical protein